MDIDKEVHYARTDIIRFSTLIRNVPSASGADSLFGYIEQENHIEMWAKSFHKSRVYTCEHVSNIHRKPFTDKDDLHRYLTSLLLSNSNQSLSKVTSINIDDHKGSVLVKYKTPKFSLYDVMTYSPAALKTSFSLLQFIAYQLIYSQYYLHSKGALLGSVSLRDIYIDDNFWLSVCPKFSLKFKDIIYCHDKTQKKNKRECQIEPDSLELSCDIKNAMEKWTLGELSNFDYLMVLNRCCGRELGNPNHHPVFPWIMDFTQPLGGWRDLTKSKFRLNKGDDQLDQTYEVARKVLEESADYNSDFTLPTTTPHHISDVLSDITYYTYKARRTDKAILCQHVRSKWVPNEYPPSIKRMQEWTPDECIPEFFTDPTIFQSVHDDLPDLEIPSWADSPEDFVSQHRCALESDYVSSNLHHWIDLTFGYKLSGKAAIKAKNVCLELVDGHTKFTDFGIIQLFTEPHPQKACKATKYISPHAPEIFFKYPKPNNQIKQSESLQDSSEIEEIQELVESISNQKIILPPDFNPLELLERTDLNMAAPENPLESKQECRCRECPYHKDTLYLGCLLAQIILPLQSRLLPACHTRTIDDYVAEVKELVMRNRHQIARPFYSLLETALGITEPVTSTTALKLPPVVPGLILNSSIVPMPTYFYSLYQLISYQTHYNQLAEEGEGHLAEEEEEKLDVMRSELLNIHLTFIMEHFATMTEEHWHLYIPYIQRIFSDVNSNMCVKAAWKLFGKVSQVLGMEGTQKHLATLIQQLLNRNDISRRRRVMLYHRSFVQQLMMQLGLKYFLQDFIHILVETLCMANYYSEHDETTTDIEEDSGFDLADVLKESLVWLAGRLGPLLTAKYITDKLLQTLKGCDEELISTVTVGDSLLISAIRCLEDIAFIYGEQYILLQYIPYVSLVVSSSDNGEVMEHTCNSLIVCCTLLVYIIPCLTEGTLIDIIEHKIIKDIVLPLVSIVSCPQFTFPGSSDDADGSISRKRLAFRILDLIVIISERIGFDYTRRFLKSTLQAFFRSFDIVHLDDGIWYKTEIRGNDLAIGDSNELFLDVRQSSMDKNEFYVAPPIKAGGMSPTSCSVTEMSRDLVTPESLNQLKNTFTAELAHKAYILCCRLAGGHYVDQNINDDLIRELCSTHEQEIQELQRSQPGSPIDPVAKELFGEKSTNWFIPVPGASSTEQDIASSPYGLSGNRLMYTPPVIPSFLEVGSKAFARIPSFNDGDIQAQTLHTSDQLRRSEMEEHTSRHLKGDWIAYWEHELGQRDRSRKFDFKQIGLQTFIGHTGSVRYIHSLDNENSFISCAKDKTVKLWSLRNTGNGTARCTAQFTYTNHKRSVFSGAYLNSVKKIVSCDGSIHLWDPQSGIQESQYDPSKTGGVTAIQTLPSMNHVLLAATTDSTIRFIDIRTDKMAQEIKTLTLSQQSLGMIKGIAVGSTWLSVAYSAPYISSFDIRNGFHKAFWHCKMIEGEFLQITSYNKSEVLTSSSDGYLTLWKYDSLSPLCTTRVPSDQQFNTIKLYNENIITTSISNRIAVHLPQKYKSNFTTDQTVKLRPDIHGFKGNLTSLSVLPCNRQLLLGSDTGSVYLMA